MRLIISLKASLSLQRAAAAGGDSWVEGRLSSALAVLPAVTVSSKTNMCVVQLVTRAGQEPQGCWDQVVTAELACVVSGYDRV